MTRPLVSGAGIVMWGAEVWRAYSHFKHDYVKNYNKCVTSSSWSNSPFKVFRAERNSKENSEDVRPLWHFLPKLPRATCQLSQPAMLCHAMSLSAIISRKKFLAVEPLILNRNHQSAFKFRFLRQRVNSKTKRQDVTLTFPSETTMSNMSFVMPPKINIIISSHSNKKLLTGALQERAT